MENFDADNFSGSNHEGPHPNEPLRFLTASSIIGDKVLSPAGEQLGKINDVMLDLEAGRMEYIVIEMGGFLGMGEKYFAIPHQLLKVDARNRTFILDQDKETLKNAPGFDKDHWPETNTHEFDSSGSYWGGFMGANSGAEPV